ncbi:MAG: flagellar filament capping protein FliD [Clostridium saudiense]|uniref:flagellar filament capping protein FliD n=1 Tax=Clostridium saudiense TaxID=1414720 RepID=UPI00290F8A4C|nr:flagellar filament capping protein FliD [Clostridium saudiense]MDU3520666.1 flagellar filament capping protein FliD [Clostridium saudiense]
MTTINSNRITGLATGMDIDEMVTNMLTGEQSKIDKAEQKKQTQTWQQEIYRDVITDVKGLYDKYFTATSADYILSSKVFTNMTVSSSNSSVITATASAGASSVNYKFEVSQLATAPKFSSTKDGLAKTSNLGDLGLTGETTFKINYGEESSEITIDKDDTIESLISKINASTDGKIKASFSEMTGKFSIESTTTGSESKLQIIGESTDESGTAKGALEFLGIGNSEVLGTDSKVNVFDSSGNIIREGMTNSSNTFTLDGITYTLNGTTNANETVTLTSTQDTQSTVNTMKAFIEEYNSMLDNIYSLVTEKKNTDYDPLTDAQKEEMSETEIEKWEEKAKAGILRNDSGLRSFVEDMKTAVYGSLGDLGISLSDIGITSVSDYNKPGQLALDEEVFTKALEENGELVYKATTAALEKIKTVTYNYAGSSASVFAKKAGIEKTSTAVNNIFSEQIKKQETKIKELITKMEEKQEALYAKFASLESSMNTLNSQMSYLVSSLSS